MCLIINRSFIAEEDIVCYKVVKEDLKSPCLEFQYKIGKTYKSILVSKRVDSTIIVDDYGFTRRNYIYIIENGLHTYSNINKAKDCLLPLSGIILKCVIPKGSKIYEDTYRCELASNCLKVLEIIEKIPANKNCFRIK